jgi:demethylmenaquinone methyltransferase/2-methoxy-6-polyprenyl-1,4-benzoquinol methylase
MFGPLLGVPRLVAAFASGPERPNSRPKPEACTPGWPPPRACFVLGFELTTVMRIHSKPDLKEHISSTEKKQWYVNRMFATIAPRYDFITRFLSYGMDGSWKTKLIAMLDLRGDERVLDIACGTGDITFALGRSLPRGQAIGLDITQGMLDIAEAKRSDRNIENVSFLRGDIMKLPFPDARFDCVTGGYALRNVPDLKGALLEIARTLKPGGRIYSLDFGHPPLRLYRWLYFRYLTVVGSGLGLVLHGDPDTYRYIPESLKLYPGQRGTRDLMQQLGFSDTGFHEFMGGIMAINYGSKSPLTARPELPL